MSAPIKLIVGLGNPGEEYRGTRHNAGADFVETLAHSQGLILSADAKFYGLSGRSTASGKDVRLLIPTTFMNRSGQAVSAIAKFYKIETANILIAHDELDFEPGTARFKDGGGHGGHNGLRDINKALGDNYSRLRIGIGHPGHASEVSNYVLKAPSRADREQIEASISESLQALPLLLCGDWVRATKQLHTNR